MGLFGFGKKNKQQPEQKPEPVTNDTPSIGSFKMVNGVFVYDPTSKPDTPSEPVKTTVSKAWSEDIDNFLARNKNSKLVKLTGKPEEFSFYEVGNRCHVVQDEDNDEKYNILCGDDVIGRLPSSAITYAEKNDCPPEDLAVIIAEIDYDLEKERDIISVYISD